MGLPVPLGQGDGDVLCLARDGRELGNCGHCLQVAALHAQPQPQGHPLLAHLLAHPAARWSRAAAPRGMAGERGAAASSTHSRGPAPTACARTCARCRRKPQEPHWCWGPAKHSQHTASSPEESELPSKPAPKLGFPTPEWEDLGYSAAELPAGLLLLLSERGLLFQRRAPPRCIYSR